jgi:predicted MFS family arabinose efflux permease
MATTASSQDALPSAAAQRAPLITRPLLLRFVSSFGASVSFYLPLSVVPMYAKASGSDASAGLATGALLLATVAVELITPRLVSRTGYRLALAIGLLALGMPALALLASSSLATILAVSVVRGAGFAVVTVAGGALTASIIPPERRGEGLALTGIVSGVPALVGLPLGVWVADRGGTGQVFVATAAAALLAVAAVPGLPDYRAAGREAAHGVLPMLRSPDLIRPAALFSASTMAAGVLVTFLPLATTGKSAAIATIALFAQPAAATLARLGAGRVGDRYGHARLLRPGILMSAAGMAALAATGRPVLVIGGAAVFGAGFGLLQNATLALMYARTARGGYNAVSAIWNAAYDAGMGAGAIGMGMVTGHVGYSATFLLTAALVVPALIPARRECRSPIGKGPGCLARRLSRHRRHRRDPECERRTPRFDRGQVVDVSRGRRRAADGRDDEDRVALLDRPDPGRLCVNQRLARHRVGQAVAVGALHGDRCRAHRGGRSALLVQGLVPAAGLRHGELAVNRAAGTTQPEGYAEEREPASQPAPGRTDARAWRRCGGAGSGGWCRPRGDRGSVGGRLGGGVRGRVPDPGAAGQCHCRHARDRDRPCGPPALPARRVHRDHVGIEVFVRPEVVPVGIVVRVHPRSPPRALPV